MKYFYFYFSVLNTRDFEQVWLIIKRRHYKLFEIGLMSSVQFLENILVVNEFRVIFIMFFYSVKKITLGFK